MTLIAAILAVPAPTRGHILPRQTSFGYGATAATGVVAPFVP